VRDPNDKLPTIEDVLHLSENAYIGIPNVDMPFNLYDVSERKRCTIQMWSSSLHTLGLEAGLVLMTLEEGGNTCAGSCRTGLGTAKVKPPSSCEVGGRFALPSSCGLAVAVVSPAMILSQQERTTMGTASPP
jgi:hypothetical protein